METDMKINKEELQLVVFRLSKEEYTVPIEYVQEIIMPQKPTHIPRTPDFVEGVINLRGHIIPIIDSRKRFNMTINQNNPDARIIVLELESQTVGLIVDSVSEVVHLKKAEIEPSPVSFKENDFIMGVGKLGDRLLILLEPNKFLTINEIRSLQQIKSDHK